MVEHCFGAVIRQVLAWKLPLHLGIIDREAQVALDSFNTPTCYICHTDNKSPTFQLQCCLPVDTFVHPQCLATSLEPLRFEALRCGSCNKNPQIFQTQIRKLGVLDVAHTVVRKKRKGLDGPIISTSVWLK